MDIFSYFSVRGNMWLPIYFHINVFALVMIMKSVETQIIDTLFDKVESDQHVVGKLGAEQPARKHLECSSM